MAHDYHEAWLLSAKITFQGENNMSFTILYGALTFLALIVIFAVTYKLKGWKTAFVTTGIAFILAAIAFIAAIYAITSVMSN